MYLIGLDVGKEADYTALSILRRVDRVLDSRRRTVEGRAADDAGIDIIRPTYDVVLLERARKMPYPDVVDRVVALLGNPVITGGEYRLVVDANGVGAPVADLLERHSLAVDRIVTTAGEKANFQGGTFTVPKAKLVGALIVVLQTGRMRIDSKLAMAEQLRRELEAFRMKTGKMNDTYEAATERIHDDLAMSVMMPVWIGENDYSETQAWRDKIVDAGGGAGVAGWNPLEYSGAPGWN